MPFNRAATFAALMLLAGGFAVPIPGQAQVPNRTVTPKQAPGTAAYPADPRRLRLTRHPRIPFRAAPAATVVESEPNNSVSQADLVALGDTATGTIDPTADADYFALDLAAGAIIGFDVVAEQAGSQLDAVLLLIGPDSTSIVAFNDDFYGRDSHFEYVVGATGRYFVRIQDYDLLGGPGYTYAVSFTALVPGPGDPTTLYATGLGAPWSVAAGPAGELYVTDVDSLRLLRVAPNGQVTVLAQFTGEVPFGVVVDALGDLLVSTTDVSFTSGKVVRFSGGQRSTFASNLELGAAITIGPDGDVWAIDLDPVSGGVVRRYDPVGALKGTIDLSSMGVLDFDMGLAFSPTGDLYISNAFDAIYKIVSGVPQLVFQTSPYLEGLAFDKDGYLYVANGFLGRVILLDPSFQVVDDPFARGHVSGPTQLVFPRDANGAMTSRLLADNVGFYLLPPYLGGIVEMDPTAMRAVGFRVGIDLLRIANATAKNGVVGADYADTLRLVAAPGPATWSVLSGALPPGLALSADGQLTGIPEQAGASTFLVRVDAASQYGLKSFTVTVTSPTVSLDAASQHLMGGAQLDLTLQRFLDLQGNKNGRFDVGDFRAFLRASGQLPAATVAREEHP